jgi:hypothetical protein
MAFPLAGLGAIAGSAANAYEDIGRKEMLQQLARLQMQRQRQQELAQSAAGQYLSENPNLFGQPPDFSALMGGAGQPSQTAGGIPPAPQVGAPQSLLPPVQGGRLPQAGPGVNLAGETPDFQARLRALGGAMPPDVYGGSRISSGFRTPEEQAKLYAAYKSGAGGLAAPPGQSEHNRGDAADWTFSNPAADKWAHANAGRFGLGFPLGARDPNHMQTVDGAPMQPQGLQPRAVRQPQGMSQGDQMIVKLLEPMFRQTNPAQIIQGIMQRRPDLDPGVAFEAAQQILKMGTQGSAQDRGLAALLLRDVISQRHEAATTERTGMTVAGAGERAAGRDATTQRGQNIRSSDTQRGQNIRKEQAEAAETGRNQRFQERQRRLEATKNAPAAMLNQKGASLRAMLKEIDAELLTAEPGAMSDLNEQRTQVMDELRKLSGLGQRPPSTKQEEGGGASTTLPPQ